MARSTLGRVARRLRIESVAWRVDERVRALRVRGNPTIGPDGLALPSPLMMIQVAAHADVDTFMRNGGRCAEVITETLARHGAELAQFDAVLDFGCGCGRVARHWAAVEGPRFYGCDYNRKLVDWCQANLPFLEASTNELAPPLAYDAASFDLVYALSVFTHLTEPLQLQWRDELGRVIKPGGYLYMTTHGDHKAHEALLVGTSERDAYDRGEIVIRDASVVGSNMCGAYASRSWVEQTFAPTFELVEVSPGRPDVLGHQELYLFRRR